MGDKFLINGDKYILAKTSATIETGLWLVSVTSGNIYNEQKFYYKNHTIKDVIDWIKMNSSSIEVEYVI
ncbi:MAG: hypothetical protein ACOCZ5_03750 [bacterium]